METEVPLPDDLLASILQRLLPCDLAQSRFVCRSWAALIDEHRLLLRHTLPHSVRGFFLDYVDYQRPHFLSRPSSTGPQIDGRLSFLPAGQWSSVRDHHNGLILYSDVFSDVELLVVNPAMRRWTALTPLEVARTWAAYIVFEPAVSPHYHVFLVPPLPSLPKKRGVEYEDEDHDEDEDEDHYRLMEWPPSPCVLQVFSSETGRWEERAFVREGEAAGIVADLRFETNPLRHIWRHAVRLEGTLYVQCRGSYLIRMSLHDGKYQVIKTPLSINECAEARTYLGASQNQVCFAAIQDLRQLTIWVLKESSGATDWVLKHQLDVAKSYYATDDQIVKEWILEDDPDYKPIPVLEDNQSEEGSFSGMLFYCSGDEEEGTKNVTVEETIEYNSDDDNLLCIDDDDEGYIRHITILGFHPYKEVIFVADHFQGLAYQLSTSKVQSLGALRPKYYNYSHFADIERSFVYTPCMLGELS